MPLVKKSVTLGEIAKNDSKAFPLDKSFKIHSLVLVYDNSTQKPRLKVFGTLKSSVFEMTAKK
jgi:hypothetical protein